MKKWNKLVQSTSRAKDNIVKFTYVTYGLCEETVFVKYV